MTLMLETADKTFQNDVLDEKGVILVDFWGEWCGPCRTLLPILDELSKIYKGKVKIIKLNISENPETSMKYGVRSIPTLMIFKNGELQETQTKDFSFSMLIAWINKFL